MGDSEAHHSFHLIPQGLEVGPEPRIGTLARSGGRLVGAIVDGSVCTWLAQDGGELILMVWPGTFRARFGPLELLDAEGRVLARGGEEVTVTGGYLKPGDPALLGHTLAFSAWQVSRVWESAPPRG